jgi:hypothetical protein
MSRLWDYTLGVAIVLYHLGLVAWRERSSEA